ncbi:hypothetical protein BGZ65_010746, partial [Modicella reniformis]
RLDKQVKTTAVVKPNNSGAYAEELTKVIKDLFRQQEASRHQRMNELRRGSTRQIPFHVLTLRTITIVELHKEFKNHERTALNGLSNL